MTIADLRRFAIARSLFPRTTLKRALSNLQFVQADPIGAPARAQDLILHQRVIDYRAGDLERRYAKLDLEEDYFINYGFVKALSTTSCTRGQACRLGRRDIKSSHKPFSISFASEVGTSAPSR